MKVASFPAGSRIPLFRTPTLRLLLAATAIGLLALCGCVTVPSKNAMTVGPAGGVYHIVGSGQTLWSISKAYGVSMPEVMRANAISDPNHIGVGQRLFIPGAGSIVGAIPAQPPACQFIEKLVGQRQYVHAWQTITIHHSATASGNAQSFDRNHRRRGMGGLFYHFIIGNGRGSGDGQIEVGWRWRKQRQVNRPNDIQICLVGDFNRSAPTARQWESLAGLIRVLQKQYHIPDHGIRRHKDAPCKATQCPGTRFSMQTLRARLRTPVDR